MGFQTSILGKLLNINNRRKSHTQQNLDGVHGPQSDHNIGSGNMKFMSPLPQSATSVDLNQQYATSFWGPDATYKNLGGDMMAAMGGPINLSTFPINQHPLYQTPAQSFQSANFGGEPLILILL